MEKKKGISGSTLKMIAIVTMLIDHIGAAVLARLLMVNGLGELDQTNTDAIMQWLSANGALYWMYTVMRMIGRVAFPIFCFLLVEGFLHTHDVKKICDAAWAVCIDLRDTVRSGIQQQNTRIQLSECLFYTIHWFADDDRLPCSGRKRRVESGVEGDLVYPDRGSRNGTGVFFKDRLCRKRCILYHGLIHFPQEKMWQIIAGCASFIWETPALFGFIPIAFYNGTRGWKMKYFFYIFYPAHLLILYLLCYFMGISGYSAV